MTDCPTCEYHKQRAQLWRDEAYRLAGHPLPRKETMIEEDDDIQDYKRPWVGLTDEERKEIALEVPMDAVCITEAKLKEKNNG
jgi:hypothetical protein